MDIGITASRYAKALLEFSTENKEEQKVYEEMTTAAEMFRKFPQTLSYLQNPAVSNEQKKQLLFGACGSNTEKISSSTQRFLQLIVKNNRTDLMPFFAQSYITLYRKTKRFIKGKLTVPCEISDKAQERFKKIAEELSNSKVEFQVEVAPEIEGGFVLEYDCYRLDASIRTQFNQLRRKLVK